MLNADWMISPLRTALRVTRFDEYTEAGTSNTSTADDRTFGAKCVTDLDIAVQIDDTINFAVGANNLFDVYPDPIGVIQATPVTATMGTSLRSVCRAGTGLVPLRARGAFPNSL